MNPSRLMTPYRQARLGLASVVAALFVMAWPGGADATLLVHYTFDELSGDAINSGSLGSAADGSFFNGATRITDTPSGSGSALDTTAQNTSVLQTAGAVAGLNGLSAVTVTTWLNLQGDIDQFASFLSTQNAGGGFSLASAYLVDATATAFSPRLGVNNGDLTSNNTADASDSWLFLAATWDGDTATAKIYTGGVATVVSQLSSQAGVNAWGQSVNSNGNTPLVVGNYAGYGLTTYATPGYLDDVRIYDTALDATALDAVRLEGLLVPEPSTLLLLAAGGLFLRCRR